MEETSVWLIAIIALLVGGGIGYMMGRSGNQNGRQQELEEQLEAAREELDAYKEKVSSHFIETADLVNNLTSSYAAVHKHLASSAQQLCQDPTASRALAAAMTPALPEEREVEGVAEEEANSVAAPKAEAPQAVAPRDYAPKKPDEEGTLSETFGLKESTEGRKIPQDPAELAALQAKEQAKEKAKTREQAQG